jgi:hypothetical protein
VKREGAAAGELALRTSAQDCCSCSTTSVRPRGCEAVLLDLVARKRAVLQVV